MRFRKGSKVEVWSDKESAMGYWLCAEIVSGNGHTYSVKYGWFPMTTSAAAVSERVPRKAIRPCPPPVDGLGNWVPGDLVEVFDNLSWNTAVVVKCLGFNRISVRLLGSSSELTVPKSHLRVRQSWEDGKWFVVGEGSGNCDVSMGKREPDFRLKMCVGAGEIRRPQMISTGALKRKSLLDISEVGVVAAQKRRSIEKDGTGLIVRLRLPSLASEKVDAFVSRQKVLGEKYMHSSFHNGTILRPRTDSTNENDRVYTGTLLTSDTDSDASSVGSCTTDQSENLEDYCSDAESHNSPRLRDNVCSVSTNVVSRTNTHRSEQCANSCGIEALHASGPLDWKENQKVTNLQRISN